MTSRIVYNEYALKYDAQTGAFTVGNIVYGATSGAYATIKRIDRSGIIGTLYLESITGTFQDNEVVYEASYEGELVTNGDMELDANWDNYGTPTTNERSDEQKHGGTYSRKFVGNEATDGIASIAIAVTADSFYIYDGYLYISALTADAVSTYIAETTSYSPDSPVTTTTTTGSFQQCTGVFQASTAGVKFASIQSGAGAVTAYLDDASLKKITNAALANGTVQSPITIDLAITRQGVVPNFKQEKYSDMSSSGKMQVINFHGIQEMTFDGMFSRANYHNLLAWWSWARQGKVWGFAINSSKMVSTTLDGGAASGQKVIPLTLTTGLTAGDFCFIKQETQDNAFEVVEIASVAAGVSITTVANLKFDYTTDDTFRHMDYWPDVISTDSSFKPTRTGVNAVTGKYYRNTFNFIEAL